ncbi:hypothetical protein ACFFLM_04410 [Deinococcus oregonensis]|uniref:Uncharacterized protein n=1 Tax=Deinococcus oregonensis TaxID=1805970 RepID=A0ABV6AUW0_9DEIO
MSVQAFITALKVELEASLPSYSVQAFEPIEGQLKVGTDSKFIFITTEGIESPEGVADMGASTRIRVPVLVSCVMALPDNEVLAAKILRRRLVIIQACQRVVRDFDPNVLVYLVQEQPSLIEGFYVSIVQLDVQYDLQAEEEL